MARIWLDKNCDLPKKRKLKKTCEKNKKKITSGLEWKIDLKK